MCPRSHLGACDRDAQIAPRVAAKTPPCHRPALGGRRRARTHHQLGTGLEGCCGQAAIVEAGLDGAVADPFESLIVELAAVFAGVRLEGIVETKRRAEAGNVETVAARLVESLGRAQQPSIGHG